MVNATWDDPAPVAPTAKRAKEHQRICSQPLKALLLSSPSKSSSDTFKSDKGIDRLLSLLRTQSFCGQAPPENERVPKDIVCNMGVLKRTSRTLDERIKRMSMSDSKTSIASTLSDNSMVSLASLLDDDKKICADSHAPAKRARHDLSMVVEESDMARIESFQTA